MLSVIRLSVVAPSLTALQIKANPFMDSAKE
jgi:hypothetical protein